MSEYNLLYSAVETAAGSFPVALPNRPYPKEGEDDGVPYFRAFVIPDTKVGLGIGYNSSDRQRGICQVSCYARESEGEGPAVSMADQIIAAFPKGTTLSDTITVEIYDPSWKSSGLATDGWYMIPVTIPYNIIT